MDATLQQQYLTEINALINLWTARKEKFTAWYDLLNLKDQLARPNLESYVSNNPRTQFNMAHFLLTSGTVSHKIPAAGSSPIEIDRQSKVERACRYMWRLADQDRQRFGMQPFLFELAFNVLALGWFSTVAVFDKKKAIPIIKNWSPAETYVKFEDGRVTAILHSYELDISTAVRKAKANNWTFAPSTTSGKTRLDDYFFYDEDDKLQNVIFIASIPVTEVIERSDMVVLAAPVGGFPDMGSISGSGSTDWVKMIGQSFLEPMLPVEKAMNKWNSFQMQILRDTAQPMWQEFSQGQPKATPEQIGKRGAFFHYGVNEKGLQAIVPPPIPMELRATLVDLQKEAQKSGFPDLLFGLTESIKTGYAYDRITNNAAIQVLHPFSRAIQFVIAEIDRFWLSQLKTSKKAFNIRGRQLEVLRSTEIPDDVDIEITTDLPTPKDWLERATVANYLKDVVDDTTLMDEILHFQDPLSIKRKKVEDLATKHPASVNLQLIQSYRLYAQYLIDSGYQQQAQDFIKAADGLASQFGIPPAGSARPNQASEAEALRLQGAPEEEKPVLPQVAPPQATQPFSPEQMRDTFGSGEMPSLNDLKRR